MTKPAAKPAILSIVAAPHRLPFLTGAVNLTAIMCWWLTRLAQLNGAPLPLAQRDMLQATYHGPATIYGLYMPFILGFLLTVFPRWMGMPDLKIRQYLPPSILVAAGSLLLDLALWTDRLTVMDAALATLLLGWAAGGLVLIRVLLTHRRTADVPHWHGLSALGGWALALAGLAAFLSYAVASWPSGRSGAILLGTHGLTAIIFLTICHRMIPFFAGNVVEGYVRWRPYWLIGAIWLLVIGDMAATLWAPPLRVVTAGGLAMLLAYTLWRWMPRRAAPGLLLVLLFGLAWAPIAFAFAALSAVSNFPAIASTHALLLGMGASLIVGMVTRVTQGHSGRPLTMPIVAWIAFVAAQAATITRIGAAIDHEALPVLVTAAAMFVAGLFPWAVRNAVIYLSPRKDGRPG